MCPCVKGPRWACAGGTRTTTQTVVGHNPQQRMATTKSSNVKVNFCGSPCLAVFRFVRRRPVRTVSGPVGTVVDGLAGQGICALCYAAGDDILPDMRHAKEVCRTMSG